MVFSSWKQRVMIAGLALAAAGWSGAKTDPLDAVAERYVQLVLAVGQHSSDYVDAYYGPAVWREMADQAGRRPLTELAAEAEALLRAVAAVEPASSDPLWPRRHAFLAGQLSSVQAYVGQLQGQKRSFDEEAKALYGVEPPHVPLANYESIRDRLDAVLPGDGDVTSRYLEWRKRFAVPHEKLTEVMQAATDEARRRTLEHVRLPADESFELALVTDKPWGAYNWYRGQAHSLIEVNVTQPVYVSQIIHYAAHEGYPGHHVFNALQESVLAVGRGWVEHTVLPLFSPTALMAEGTAEAGAVVVFPTADRRALERERLFPLAGLPVAEVERYAEVTALVKDLAGARVQLARHYLQGEMTADEVVEWMSKYSLVTPAEARRSVSFFDTYRSYVVNYTMGEQMVLAWIQARAGDEPEARWAALVQLLSEPRLPASLLERPAR